MFNRGFVWVFRASLFIGLLSAVVTVIYFTPVPDLQFASCDRPCHELDWPMICRFKLYLELHQVMGGWCGDCPNNITHCFRPGCIIGDGETRRVMAVNKQLPGPSIQVCENDILVVDVVNKIPGQGVAIHWRGQHQKESPYMDGVPMITQCPISSYTTFQYKFRAAQAGTHLWHAHTGNELLDGIFGSLIIRRADKLEEHRHLYDEDDPHHVLIINEWGSLEPLAPNNREDSQILVNGIAYKSNHIVPKLTVSQGVRYRIRLAHAGGGKGCPLYLTINQHTFKVIYMDGKSVKPKEVSALKISQGERMDIVLHANQYPKNYWLKVESNCTRSVGLAKLEYEPKDGQSEHERTTSTYRDSEFINPKLLSTVVEEKCHLENEMPETICLPQVEGLKRIPQALADKIDMKLYLSFDYMYTNSVRSAGDLIPRINNITFMFPPSPILSQSYDLGTDLICKAEKKPKRCNGDNVCECVHVIDIPLKTNVEVVLLDLGKESLSEHVFHLHGHSFYVVGITDQVGKKSLDSLKALDQKGLLIKRNLMNPVVKDTVTVPKNGAVAFRFQAENPGYWLLHDQSASRWASGLDVVFKIGEARDLPSAPDNFPQCGSWVGPEFFLI